MSQPEKRLGIMDLPVDERPRERLAQRGEGALSKRELLAILLRVGVEGMSAVELSGKILDQFGELRGLHAASFDDLCAVKGLGPAKAAQIKAAIELGYRLQQESEGSRPKFSKPEDINKFMRHQLAGTNQEELWVLSVNTRSQLIRKQQLYKGTINHSSARMAEIMEIPIRLHSAAIILVHNHPSGDPEPSREDIRFTEALVRAGQLMDINILDHIIIGKNDFRSIRRMGQVSFKTSMGKSWD
jgi:DNA repair protein RadC